MATILPCCGWRPRQLGTMWLLAALLLWFALAGCVAIDSSEMSNLDFRLRGKIAVRVDRADRAGRVGRAGREAFTASFDWRQAGARYEIDLWGPLGQGHIRISGNGPALSVTDSRGETLHGARAGALMEQALGWSVPTTTLRHWVRGRYDPSTPAAIQGYAEDGRLKQFEQLGWTVRVQRWRDAAIGPAPGKIVAEQAQRRIVVVCHDWSRD